MTDMEGVDPSTGLGEAEKAQMGQALAREMANRAFVGPLSVEQEQAPSREIMAIQAHARKKQELAETIQAGAVMRVDPAEVDDLAKFFEDEARGLEERIQDVQALADIPPPGGDPVSTQVVAAYAQVASGDSKAYLDNYKELITVFKEMAANLRANAQQTRTDDQHAQECFRGGKLA